MKTEIGAYEAKTRLPELLRRVKAGEGFTITHRGKPITTLDQDLLKAAAKAGVKRFA
jgi:antitoxin (DNA-binding transcriptional repressor) of toxin-antitoxin stability system